SAAVVQERFERLVGLQDGITLGRNEARVGRVEEVMAEGPSKRDPSIATTRSRGNRIVHVPGRWEPGSVFRAVVTRAAPHYLEGEPVS
ncbi:MAG: TRAM domain-containing protein, partial [Deltaproteobacteria bacterium]|nr:TRAM domain-containing protein [Deltaproteobacteria bacterium]